MGLLVADSKTFNNGLTLSNFVISIRGSLRGIEKTNIVDGNGNAATVYRSFYTIYYYASAVAYAAGSCWMDSESCTLDLTEAQASGDIFAAVYADIASKYQNTSAN